MDRRGFLGAGAKGVAALLLSASVAKKALAHLPSAAALIEEKPVAVEAALIPEVDPYTTQVMAAAKDIARNIEGAVFGYWDGGYWYPSANDMMARRNGVRSDCFTMPDGTRAFL